MVTIRESECLSNIVMLMIILGTYRTASLFVWPVTELRGPLNINFNT